MFLMPDHKWARLLAYVSGLVNQKLLLQNEYRDRLGGLPKFYSRIAWFFDQTGICGR